MNYLLRASLRAFPAVKAGRLEAGMFITACVLGFLPVLAAFVFTSKGEKVSFKNDNIVIRLRRYELDHGNILNESTLNLYTE